MAKSISGGRLARISAGPDRPGDLAASLGSSVSFSVELG